MSKFSSYIYADEPEVVHGLLSAISWDDSRSLRVDTAAKALVQSLRRRKGSAGQLETFLQQFPLNSSEGIALMALAESLLRIPDSETADDLIEDKIAAANWLASMGNKSGSWVTKAAGLG